MDLEEHFKSISQTATALVNEWIKSPESVPSTVTEALASYEEPKAPSISDLVAFSIIKMKKKSNKGVEVSFGVSTGANIDTAATPEPIAKIDAAGSASLPISTPALVVDDVATSTTSAPVKRVNATKAQASKIVEDIIPSLFTAMASSGLEFAEIAQIVALEKNVEQAEVNLRIAGSKAKLNKVASQALLEAKTALAAFPEDKRKAYEKVKIVLSAGLIPELNMFKNEAYTAGLLSVKDRDRLSHNHRR